MFKFLLLIFVYFYYLYCYRYFSTYLSFYFICHSLYFTLYIFFSLHISNYFIFLCTVYHNSFFHLDISYYLSRVYVILCIIVYVHFLYSTVSLSLYCNSLSLSISLPPYLFVCLPFSSCSYLSHLCCSHAARHCSSSNFSLLKFLIKINFETQKTLGGVPGPCLPVIYHYYYY